VARAESRWRSAAAFDPQRASTIPANRSWRIRSTGATGREAGLLCFDSQRGHGLGVSMEVHTISDLEQKRAAVKKLEAAVLRRPQPESQVASANLA